MSHCAEILHEIRCRCRAPGRSWTGHVPRSLNFLVDSTQEIAGSRSCESVGEKKTDLSEAGEKIALIE